MNAKRALAGLGLAAAIGTGFAAPANAADQETNTKAMQEFSATVGATTAGTSIAGTIIGGALGCAIGGGLTAPTVVFIPAGCLAGLATGAAVGGVVVTAVVGGPVAVVAGVKLVQVLLTPAAPAL